MHVLFCVWLTFFSAASRPIGLGSTGEKTDVKSVPLC